MPHPRVGAPMTTPPQPTLPQPIRPSGEPWPLAEPAYRVPWRVDRSREPWFTLVNESDEPARGVQITLSGDGRLLWRPLLTVAAGEQVTFVVQADDPARNCIACVRWFRPDGTEYLWRISF